jgi:son of sevenless-like protein
MVRAQFDFDASDPSALSFKAGDIIEVYTMLESGWWDGMLDGRRGWFPSNFVEEMDDEGDEEESSSSQNEYSHGLGLVGDQMDRERDMQMLEREDFGVPLHHPSNRTRGRSGSGLGGADGFGGNLDELMRGGAGWGSGPGLDDLAREMMESNLQDEEEEEDEGAAFEAEAARRREARRSDDTDTGEFGDLRTPHHPRRREHTDNTIRQRPSVASGRAGASDAGQGITPVKQVEETQDAWIPSLTPDGQVSL